MTASLLTPPNSTALTTLARVKEELLITGSDSDDFLARLIDEASETIARLGRPLYRAEWVETREGSTRELLQLSRYPIASLGTVLLETSVIADCEIGRREAGQLYRPGGFGWSGDPNEWSVTYTAGWFLPGDDISTSISVLASDDSYNSATSLFPALLRAGDTLYASGFTAVANNGYKTVVSATTAKITVSGALVDEAAATREIALRNLPGDLERLAQTMVATVYHGRDRDPSLKSLKLGPASWDWGQQESTRPLLRQIERLALPL